MRLPKESHPIWKIVSMAVMMFGVTFCLWLNASSFDSTEVTTIVEIVAWGAGFEIIKSKVLEK